MIYIIKSIGLLMVIVGVLFAALPGLMLRIIEFMKAGKRVYIIGVARIVLGGLLLWASPVAANMWIPAVIGGLIAISGITIFLIGVARVHAMMGWWAARPDRIRSLMAILVASIGVLLIFAA